MASAHAPASARFLSLEELRWCKALILMGLSIRSETQTLSSFVTVLDFPPTIQELLLCVFCPSFNCTLNLEIFIIIILALWSREEKQISLLHIHSIYCLNIKCFANLMQKCETLSKFYWSRLKQVIALLAFEVFLCGHIQELIVFECFVTPKLGIISLI